ncbi:MAG: thiamine biosynthesis protein ThiS [Micavibrio sp.]|nr:thiamine biosynthesis protein ThiS [Micavibrio sp.]|tara:strand:+ start:660 stop:875 length:216 start_codon:yes stop_codon:yes gene_type:complete
MDKQQIKLTINGLPKDFEAPLNLYDVLAQEEVIEMMIAVARNRTVIPKGDWAQTFLDDGDIIEILAPMQGG